ncbi:MAG: complex I NDUFA9 subunit family protein [Magnetospiraceae bacterium]
MNILLTGASGFIGGHLLRDLAAAGHKVIACTRAPLGQREETHVSWIPADFTTDTDKDIWRPRLEGIDCVINAAGIIAETPGHSFAAIHREGPMALFQAAVAEGISRVVQISSLGADPGAGIPYFQSKGAGDAYLQSLDADWVILRPSLVFGPGGGSAALFAALASLPVVPLIDGGGQKLQPIFVEDLARVVMQAVAGPGYARRLLDLVGPDEIPFREMLAHYRNWLGLGPLRPVCLPGGLASGVARLGGVMGLAAVTPDTLAMLRQGNTAPVAPLIEACGFTPRSLADVLAAHPASAADRRRARRYFAKALCRKFKRGGR